MKQKVTLFITSLFISLQILLSVLTPAVHAVNVTNPVCGSGGGSSAVCQDAGTAGNPLLGPDGIITKVVQFLTFLIGLTAVIVIIIAGLRLITGGSNPDSISRARNTIIYAIVGLAVAAFSQAIVSLVLSKV
jgi:hypothetical protein